MFLSMYASYRWAKSKHYTIKMAAFIVLASLLSSIFAWPSIAGVILGGPCSVLSFPFYSASSIGDNPLLQFYQIHFLIWVIDTNPFILFMLANILGAALGYLINKSLVFPENYGLRGLLLFIALGVAIIWVGFWLYYLPEGPELVGYKIYRDFDAWRFWTFGFTWIAVVAGDFILHRPKSEQRTKLE